MLFAKLVPARNETSQLSQQPPWLAQAAQSHCIFSEIFYAPLPQVYVNEVSTHVLTVNAKIGPTLLWNRQGSLPPKDKCSMLTLLPNKSHTHTCNKSTPSPWTNHVQIQEVPTPTNLHVICVMPCTMQRSPSDYLSPCSSTIQPSLFKPDNT